jgi:hypothetical protein
VDLRLTRRQTSPASRHARELIGHGVDFDIVGVQSPVADVLLTGESALGRLNSAYATVCRTDGYRPLANLE